MSRRYFDLTALVTAAADKGCMVHLHLDDFCRPVFSVGNEYMGATEFLSYSDALEALKDMPKRDVE